MAMIYAMPDFYPQFRCIASRCRHSCCVGWEIDIDRQTAELYRAMEGELGEKLRNNICDDGTPHFAMKAGNVCPFLNSVGLCELILQESEDILCEICREHPRFYVESEGRSEVGLGLCCEEAARLLLSWDCGVTWLEYGDGDEGEGPETQAVLALRDELYALAQDRARTIPQRMDALLRRVAMPEYGSLLRGLEAWFSVYDRLEKLDETWETLRHKLAESWREAGEKGAFLRSLTEDTLAAGYENLLVYFLSRYVLSDEPGDPGLSVGFAVLSTVMIAGLDGLWLNEGRALTLDQRAEHARLYSGEIEYSDENVGVLTAALARFRAGQPIVAE